MKPSAGVIFFLVFAFLLAAYSTPDDIYPEYSYEFGIQWPAYPEYGDGFPYISAEYPIVPFYGDDGGMWRPTGSGLAEYGDKFEGDLILTAEQSKYLSANNKNNITNDYYKWPQGRVFYRINDNHFDDLDKEVILSALDDIQKVSCVRFYEASAIDDAYINITGFDDNCYAQVGRIGYEQPLNLQPKGCLYVGTIVHEFSHALGFHHQHTVPERDDFVVIKDSNIKEDSTHHFQRIKSSYVKDFGVEYDYNSILHFNKTAYSKNELPTIESIYDDEMELGQRQGMSIKDIVKLNMMYECDIPSEKLEAYAKVLCERHNKKT